MSLVRSPQRSTRRALAWAGVVALFIAGIAVGFWWHSVRSSGIATPRVARLNVSLPSGAELVELSTVAVSPDGEELAYAATRDGVQQIYLQRFDASETTVLRGTEGGSAPFFSPDSRSLAFFANGKLKKVSTAGGIPVILADARVVNAGGAWGPDDMIVFRGPIGSGLLAISASGGQTRTLVEADVTESGLPRYPQFLPGGTSIIFNAVTPDTVTADEQVIEALTLATGARKVIVRGGSHVRYLPTGHLLFLRSGTLMAAAFDATRLELTGAPVAIVSGVRETVNGVGLYDCSQTGTCVYATGGLEGSRRTVVQVDRSGDARPLPLPPQSYGQPRVSPAGDKIVFWIERTRCDAMVYDLTRGSSSLLTLEGDSHFPVWTPNQKQISYLATRPDSRGTYELFSKPADGSGPETRLVPEKLVLGPLAGVAWSPDGGSVAYSEGSDIWILPVQGEHKPRPFFQSRFNENMPAFSPDGHWLAYVSDESGHQEVYVQAFPGPGGKYPISTDGGTEPVWARNGHELFFRNGDRMMVAAINTQPAFTANKPTVLFVESLVRRTGRISYDVMPDGRHFIMLKEGDTGQSSTQLNVILNWQDELKQRAPANAK